MGLVNPVYTSRNLKNHLENHEISVHIAFTNVDPGNVGCYSYNLIYNASLSVSEAVVHAYQLGSKDSLMETARLLRGIIQKAFSNATPLRDTFNLIFLGCMQGGYKRRVEDVEAYSDQYDNS